MKKLMVIFMASGMCMLSACAASGSDKLFRLPLQMAVP